MNPWARGGVVAATVTGLVVLFVVLQPDAATEGRNPPSPSTPSSVHPTSSATAAPSPSAQPARTLIEVVVRNGKVQGPDRPTATQGDRVRIVVRADVSDHVHLHGYDIMADVSPGRPTRIDFVAGAAGVFECELEDAGMPLFHLEILP